MIRAGRVKREIAMTTIRELSLAEADAVAGGAPQCIQVYQTGSGTAWAVIPCTLTPAEQYIDAFLKGVEQGRKKGQKT